MTSPHGSDPKEAIKELILEHKGADNPITSREINEEFDLDNIGSFPSTRALVRELVLEEGIPIAGSSQGYFVIETEEELQDYKDNLESRIMNITERRYAIQRAVDRWDEELDSADSDLL